MWTVGSAIEELYSKRDRELSTEQFCNSVPSQFRDFLSNYNTWEKYAYDLFCSRYGALQISSHAFIRSNKRLTSYIKNHVEAVTRSIRQTLPNFNKRLSLQPSHLRESFRQSLLELIESWTKSVSWRNSPRATESPLNRPWTQGGRPNYHNSHRIDSSSLEIFGFSFTAANRRKSQFITILDDKPVSAKVESSSRVKNQLVPGNYRVSG